MRARILLIASLTMNVLLIGGLLSLRTPQIEAPAPEETSAPVSGGHAFTNTLVRKQFVSWEELESADYQTYIENLRDINCPEQTIRDIIIADVNALFGRRRSTEALPIAQQWWQSEPDPQLVAAANRQLKALNQERDQLLTKLLGADWDRPVNPAPPVAIEVPLEGAILGTLSEETGRAVQDVSARTQQEYEEVLYSSGPGRPDPAALAALEVQLRNELAPLLNHSQMQEFLYRYSPTSHRLSAELQAVPLFNATDPELRTLYRNVEQIDLQLLSLTGDSPGVESQRTALRKQREIAFQNSLGPARYREYQRLQDPAYREAVAAAQEAGITSAAELFYAIDQAGEQEAADIREDPTLTPLQQEMKLSELELQQLQAAGAVLGEAPLPESPPPPQRTYAFQRGDTIADVSMRTGVPVALILRANPTLQAENIPVGTEIIIPDRTPPPPP